VTMPRPDAAAGRRPPMQPDRHVRRQVADVFSYRIGALPRDHPSDRTHEFLRLIRWITWPSVTSYEAVAHVPIKQAERNLVESSPGGVDLRHDVDAVAVLFDHPGDTPDLTLDPGKPAKELVPTRRVAPRLRCHRVVPSSAPVDDNTPRGYR